MRAGCLIAVLGVGCSFNVQGTVVDDTGSGAPGTPSPTQSLPDGPDAGTSDPPATSPTPPAPTPPVPTPPDMALERIGTACTADAQCDSGLVCAQSFGIGIGRIDIPGGYCTHECSKTPCPANSFCNSFSFGKYCVSSCPPDPCRPSYQCCDEGGGQNGCAPDTLCPGGKGDH